jgi:hypothetical protein
LAGTQPKEEGYPLVGIPEAKLDEVREVTGRSRNRLYVSSKYLAVLEEGTAD